MLTPYDPMHSRDDGDSASRVSALARLASDALRLMLRPAAEAVAVAGQLERRTRAVAGEVAGSAALAVIDAVIASPYAQRAVDHGQRGGAGQLAGDALALQLARDRGRLRGGPPSPQRIRGDRARALTRDAESPSSRRPWGSTSSRS